MSSFIEFILNFLISPGIPKRKDFRAMGILIVVIVSLALVSALIQ